MEKNFYNLKRERETDEEELRNLEEWLKENEKNTLSNREEHDALDDEIQELIMKIGEEQKCRQLIQCRYTTSESKMQEIMQKSRLYSTEHNNLVLQRKELFDDLQSISQEIDRHLAQLEKTMQINALNDSFYIWYAGPYGTINNFRLGNTSIKPIESNEINAALGEAALAISLIAMNCQLEFRSYLIAPMGSFPKIIKIEDRSKTVLSLYIDQGSFSLFPKRNFNSALAGFLCCISELGDFVATYDPTMTMPYKINIQDSKIGDVPFTYGIDEEIWTRSLKFMLSNVKWIIAWYAKHGKTLSTASATTSLIY